MASWHTRSARSAGTLIAGLLVAVVSGCATAPSGGAPQRLQGQSGQQQAFVAPLAPPPPGISWTASDVVQGFLAASANFELDPSAAQQYLAPGVTLPWNANPGQPPVVTVVTEYQAGTSSGQQLTGRLPTETVKVKGERIASLSSRGDYLYEPGTETYTFQLGDYGGTWLIQRLPSLPDHNLLLLTETAFEQVFQPRNLYFFGPQDGPSENYLVPDPVFVPLEVAGATDATSVATELVEGLLKVAGSQATWLSSATYTAFPGGTTLARPGVSISNLTARVSLDVPVASTPAELSQMYAQLSETLTSSAYSPPIVQHVQLVVNGKVEHVGTGYASVPVVGTPDDSLYFAAPGGVGDWNSTDTPAKVMTPDVLPSNLAITAVAVSPGANPQLAVAVRYQRGCEVFAGRAGQATDFSKVASIPGACTSLSWDNDGTDLWMVAGSGIWVLAKQGQQSQTLMQVDPPSNVPGQVLALRIAPDGVRAAFLVHTPSGNEMLLAAVTYSTGVVTFGPGRPVGTDVLNPIAISWYKPDDLIAVGGLNLYEVPLTGSPSSNLLTNVPPGTVAISAAGSNELAIRTRAGDVYTSPTPGSGWGTPIQYFVEAGPDYPG